MPSQKKELLEQSTFFNWRLAGSCVLFVVVGWLLAAGAMMRTQS
jgi:hypothetical protein